MSGLPSHDQFQCDFDRQFNRVGKAFGAWFVFCAVMGVAILAVVIWAVIWLVLHFT